MSCGTTWREQSWPTEHHYQHRSLKVHKDLFLDIASCLVSRILFKARIGDARLWKNLLAGISTLIEEADFNAAPEGIKLKSMDPSHVAMVDFVWENPHLKSTLACNPPRFV